MPVPTPTPLAKPFTPSSRAMTTGAANSAAAPPTMPLAADLRPELSPALASFGFLHHGLSLQHQARGIATKSDCALLHIHTGIKGMTAGGLWPRVNLKLKTSLKSICASVSLVRACRLSWLAPAAMPTVQGGRPDERVAATTLGTD